MHNLVKLRVNIDSNDWQTELCNIVLCKRGLLLVYLCVITCPVLRRKVSQSVAAVCGFPTAVPVPTPGGSTIAFCLPAINYWLCAVYIARLVLIAAFSLLFIASGAGVIVCVRLVICVQHSEFYLFWSGTFSDNVFLQTLYLVTVS